MLALLPEDGFPDVGAYRAQVEGLTVVGHCTCGCPTIDFQVDGAASRSARPGVPSLPLWASTDDPNDADDVVDITLWAPEGFLTELNVNWYGAHPPSELPDARALTVGPAPEPIRVE